MAFRRRQAQLCQELSWEAVPHATRLVICNVFNSNDNHRLPELRKFTLGSSLTAALPMCRC